MKGEDENSGLSNNLHHTEDSNVATRKMRHDWGDSEARRGP